MTKLTTATATTAIADLYDGGNTSRDSLIMELVSDGYSLNMATNGYSAFAKERGLTSAIVSHKADALEWLAEHHPVAFWTPEAVGEALHSLVDKYSIADSTARDYCKAYSELLGVDHPVADQRAVIFDWFKAQGDTASKDEFLGFCKGLGRSASNANEYWKGYELHLYLSGK